MSDELDEVRVRAGRVRGFASQVRDDDRAGRERRREERDDRVRRLFEREDRPPARSPPPADDIPEVEVIGRRPPDQLDSFTWRGQTGPREVWRELFNRRPDIGREVISDLAREEELEWDRAVAKAKGDLVKARAIFRAALTKAGYALNEIESVLGRVAGAARRAAQEFAPEVTEVVVRAARSPAARVLTGTPLGLAGAVVEGALRLGREASRRALDRAVRRIAPPPVAPFPPVGALPPPPGRPQDVLPVPPLEVVTITAPRDRPVSFDQVFTGTRSPTPTRTRSPTPTRTRSPTPTRTRSPTPTRLLLPGPAGFTGAIPGGLTGDRTRPVPSRQPQPSARPAPAPVALAGCPPCSPDKGQRKRKKRKPRTVCYTGTYRDLRNGLSKRKRERIPCE